MRDDNLLQPAAGGSAIPAREAWRIFGIMAEFVEATERLAGIRPAVSIFGSARATQGSPHYALAEKTARLLSDAGFDGMIDPADVDLLQEIDEPQQVVDAIFAYYEKRGFEPSPAEREILLNL